MKLIYPLICSLLLVGCGSNSDKNEISPTVEPVVQVAPATQPIAATLDGKTIYTQKCLSCHGMKGEKSALGKSQIIADFTEEQITDALKGYQDGSYGKEMKGVMQGQVKSLEAEQIDALAHYITTL